MKGKEANLQANCVKAFRYLYPGIDKLLFAVPNGGSRNAIEAANLKRQGVTAGVSDLILLVGKNGYYGLCIELKVDKNQQSEHQVIFQHQAEKQGYKYIIIRSLDEFLSEIEKYFK